MNEAQMRDAKVPPINTPEELMAYIKGLVEQEHDYGTCVYAMSMAAAAAFYYVSGKLGVTGFQASCADMDFLRRTRGIKCGFLMLNYDDLLYPQYDEKFNSVSFEKLIAENAKVLSAAAKKLLAEQPDGNHVHPDVRAHWERLAGMSVEEEKSA